MPRTIARLLLIPLALAAAPALAATTEAPETDMAAQPPGASGSSLPVPPGKVMLPPLPLAKMPDTSLPKEPDATPLPETAVPRPPARAKPGGS